MKLWQNYLQPHNLAEALQAMADSPTPALIIAGGTDLMIDLKQGNHPPVDTLVDVTAIPDLTFLGIREEKLFVGAAVPLSQIAASTLVREHAESLVEACSLIGGPQVRNVATLGGNVAHALPAGDGTIAMLCLDVQAEVVGLEGSRRIPLVDLFLGPGRSALKSGSELLTGFYIPLRMPFQASAFRRVMKAQGIALPILNLSVWLERRNGSIRRVRIAAGPSGPTPRLVNSAEEILSNQALDDELVEEAIDALLSEVSFRSSPHRASADYRRHLVGVLMRDTLQCAWERAGSAEAG